MVGSNSRQVRSMKKIVMLMAAAVAAFGISSCSKEIEDNTPTQEEAKEFTLDISVANLDGSVETRAVKKGWEVGDRINIWFDRNYQATPDLVIKFDGNDWHRDATLSSGNSPVIGGGYIKYFYEGFNDLTKYPYLTNDGSGPATSNLFYGDSAVDYDYTRYTYADGVLGFEIKYWKIRTEFQIVIPGIDPDKYMLKSDRLLVSDGVKIRGGSTAPNNINQYNYYTNGVANADGAAFYFLDTNDNGTTDYHFTLENKETHTRYIYTAKDKTHKAETFSAIRLNLENFTVDNDNSAEVNIPDPAFKAYCIENFDKNHDSKLSEAEAALVTSIVVNNLGIESLEGLQHFTSLSILCCNNNKLESLDVSRNLQLRHLECDYNMLESLDVSKNTALWYLECYGTATHKLTSLDLSNNTKLEHLYCNNNNITELDLAKNTKLYKFDASGNPLGTIDLSKNINLDEVTLWNCSLTSLDISHIGLGETWRDNVLYLLDVRNNPDLKVITRRSDQRITVLRKDDGASFQYVDL